MYLLDPYTLELKQKKLIKSQITGKGLYFVNELQYIGEFYTNGEHLIMANVYGQTDVVLIELESMRVKRRIDFSKLKQMEMAQVYEDETKTKDYDHQNNVLNGIAYNPVKKTFYLTGKMWHDIYEVRLFTEEEIRSVKLEKQKKMFEEEGIDLDDLRERLKTEL